ncbi:MAG: GNAT family protein [Patescibacteria group bacterium]
MNRTIVTKQFMLRPFRASDAAALQRNIDHPIIHRNTLRLPYPYRLHDAREWIRKNVAEERRRQPRFMAWAIAIGDEVVGSVGLHDLRPKHAAELGYWLSRRLWGRGIMPAAIRAVTKFVFQRLHLRRVEVYVFTFNRSSARVLEKCGYTREGLLRKNVVKNGKPIDEYLFAKVR